MSVCVCVRACACVRGGQRTTFGSRCAWLLTAGFRALSRTPAIVTLVVLLVSIVVLVTLTLIQIHHPQVLSPGLKVSQNVVSVGHPKPHNLGEELFLPLLERAV